MKAIGSGGRAEEGTGSVVMEEDGNEDKGGKDK